MDGGAWLHFFGDDIAYGDAACFAPWVQTRSFTDASLNGLVDPRKWLDAEWRDIARSLGVVPTGMRGMHRKGYEWTQAALMAALRVWAGPGAHWKVWALASALWYLLLPLTPLVGWRGVLHTFTPHRPAGPAVAETELSLS